MPEVCDLSPESHCIIVVILCYVVCLQILLYYTRNNGYNLNVMQQSACLVINPITVDGFAAPFNCTPVDRASDFMVTPT